VGQLSVTCKPALPAVQVRSLAAGAALYWRSLVDALKTSRPIVCRTVIALAMVAVGLALVCGIGQWDSLIITMHFRAIGPRQTWGAIFLILGFLQFWRMVDPQQRPTLTLWVNACVAGVLVLSSWLLSMAGSPTSPWCWGMALLSVWFTLRSGYTRVDRALS